jgi:hypothetical protein
VRLGENGKWAIRKKKDYPKLPAKKKKKKIPDLSASSNTVFLNEYREAKKDSFG